MNRIRGPAILLIAALLISLLPGRAMASSPVELSIVSDGAPKGGSVSIEVVLSQGSGACGGNFNICYDSTVLTLRDIQVGSGMSGAAAQINKKYSSNSARVSFAGTTEVGGVLCVLLFDISSTAEPGDYNLTLTDSRLYDEATCPVTHTVSDGVVTVQCVSLSIERVEAAAQQSVQLKVLLGGDLRPAGGNFEITYDPNMLTAGTVGKGSALSNSHSLSFSSDPAAGIIKVIWAGNTAIEGAGTLCTLTFSVAAGASGTLPLVFQNVRLYDENSKLMDSLSTDGEIRIVAPTEESPKIWVIGGATDENGDAEVGILMEGRGVICGGQFKLLYDSNRCSLTGVESLATEFGASSVVNSPLVSGDERTEPGVILFSWAGATPSIEAQLLVKFTFHVKIPGSPLTLDSVKVVDSDAVDTRGVDIRSGAIQGNGIILQIPQVDNIDVDKSSVKTEVSLTLDIADATKYTDNVSSRSIQLLVAVYDGGKMLTTTFEAADVVFNSDGLAVLPASVSFSGKADSIKVFFLSSDGEMTPCSQFALANLSG